MTNRPVLLLTRPEPAALRFAASLPQRVRVALDVCMSPLLEICITGDPFEPGNAKGLIFSSANGVGAAAILSRNRTLRAYCVGRATTAAAQDAGWPAECRGTDAETLISSLLQRRPAGPLVHLRGAESRGSVAQRLSAAGLRTREQVLYDQRKRPMSAQAMAVLNGMQPVLVPLFSPRTAQLFIQSGAMQAPLHIVALSRAVADVTRRLFPRSVTIAERPDADAMRQAIENVAVKVCRLERGRGHG
ncbi:uroporphyrinogen-III synthase [Chachezhania sediminis]|uniref:uroporphyrinogen-III synthase n=1 Tax=Chachezhania sediminis TaxID=2599291 RepID=UPI00131CACF2|nr:uroporphyrinogen-III synthase [Chachezhania sediminis]